MNHGRQMASTELKECGGEACPVGQASRHLRGERWRRCFACIRGVQSGVALPFRPRSTRMLGPCPAMRSGGFQTCCIADFQIGSMRDAVRSAGLETRDTADLEVCAASVVAFPGSAALRLRVRSRCSSAQISRPRKSPFPLHDFSRREERHFHGPHDWGGLSPIEHAFSVRACSSSGKAAGSDLCESDG